VDATLTSRFDSPLVAAIEWSTQDYRILRWSGDAPEMFGWTADEVIGARVNELNWIHPEDRPAVERALAEMVSNPRVRKVHRYRNLHKDGSVLDCEWHNFAFTPPGGPVSILSVAADLTGWAPAGQTLRASEERFRSLFDAIPDGAMVVGTDWLIERASRPLCERFGYGSPAELVGLSPRLLLAPDMRDEGARMMREQARGEQVAPVNYRVVRKDGTEFWADIAAAVLPASDGSIDGYLCVGRDITERRRIEESLRQSEERFRRVFDDCPMGMVMVSSTDGHLLKANPAFCLMLGYAEEELKERSFIDITHPEHRSADIDAVGRLWREELPEYRTEKRYLKKNGETVWGRLLAFPMFGDDGKPVGSMAMVEDVTERRRAEESLRQSQASLQAFYDSAPAMMGMVELHGDTMVAVHGNWRIAELWGTTPDELPGQDCGFPTPEIAALWLEAFRRSHSDGAPVRFEYERPTRAGTSIWISATTAPVATANSERPRCSFFAEDITARKLAEEQKVALEANLREAQKMDAVGRLAGGVAHDFNNMLMVILGNTEQALTQIDVSHPLYEDLLKIQKAALHSAQLTSQLLAFARRQMVAPKVLDLNDLVAATLKMLERLIGEDVTLTWTPGAHLWPVRLDPTQVDQVLANLCVNARDAIAGVGRIMIVTRNTTLGAAWPRHPEALPGDYVVLSVSDTGSGIPKEILDRLFEPFFTTKALGRGTGLGLSTVYGIVRQNGGFIDVSSTPGVGTVFAVHLPRYAGDAERLLLAPASEGGTGPHATVLLVEDESSLLDLIARMLTRQGYTVLSASTGEDAIRLAREHQGEIDLLLSDVVMPELTGPAVLAQVLAFRPGIRHLFMSGYPADALEPRGVTEDDDVIRKPIRMKELATRVRHALDRP
jgi:two-component system, cell cycle sensor histidine kinase and response regulator CckA